LFLALIFDPSKEITTLDKLNELLTTTSAVIKMASLDENSIAVSRNGKEIAAIALDLSIIASVVEGAHPASKQPASARLNDESPEIQVKQNYPNPFNPTTEISFALPSAADVKLEIFNIMARGSPRSSTNILKQETTA
jgi:hypothetical protein